MQPAAGPRIFRDRKKTDSKLLFDFLVWNLWFRLFFAGLRWRPFVLRTGTDQAQNENESSDFDTRRAAFEPLRAGPGRAGCVETQKGIRGPSWPLWEGRRLHPKQNPPLLRASLTHAHRRLWQPRRLQHKSLSLPCLARLPLKLGYWDTREGEGLPAPRMPPDPGPPAREGKLDYWPEARGQGVVRGEGGREPPLESQ